MPDGPDDLVIGVVIELSTRPRGRGNRPAAEALPSKLRGVQAEPRPHRTTIISVRKLSRKRSLCHQGSRSEAWERSRASWSALIHGRGSLARWNTVLDWNRPHRLGPEASTRRSPLRASEPADGLARQPSSGDATRVPHEAWSECVAGRPRSGSDEGLLRKTINAMAGFGGAPPDRTAVLTKNLRHGSIASVTTGDESEKCQPDIRAIDTSPTPETVPKRVEFGPLGVDGLPSIPKSPFAERKSTLTVAPATAADPQRLSSLRFTLWDSAKSPAPRN